MAKRIYNQISLFGPLYAYLVVISPPAAIKAKVAALKKELNNIAGISDRNLHSIAHITLMDKLTDDIGFPDTINALVANQKPFNVHLKDWGYFDHGHSVTVFIDVENQAPMAHLAELLKSSSRSPHISLAKKIPHETFEALKPYLENLVFDEEWECTEITVLRKLMSEKHLGWKDSFKISLRS